MAEKGKLMIRTYVSNMIIPVSGTRVTITKGEGEDAEIIAFRVTDADGKTEEIEFDTPDFEDSRNDENTTQPFTTVNVKVEREGYDITVIRDVQIFPERLSEQNVEMIPLPENAEFNEYYNVYTVTPQNL